ncbi:hypothetical protein [Streptomyces sp. NBC_01373]|uniref:hypothetical protein n=1 Tax=Streptomyces sp. NBC_01373 TaxID=2903843 RepID=UPI002259FA01|nr:hypothetical protein [Streptomyces sp. NBC_01373]MCX4703898.1 hypothetical protein [Streptomyces sp. NBC_01373]
MTGRKTLDQLTSDELDQLHARLDHAETFVSTVADIIADHEGDEWATHTATTAIRRGFGSVPHAVGDPELRRQLKAAVKALGTSETENAELRRALVHCPHKEPVTRVIDLHERWVKAGPPPLGASLARWWDKRLVELHNAIRPPDGQTQEQP